MKRRREKLPKWRYEFDCRKCDNIREVHDPRKGRDGDYCIPCIERMDSRRPSPRYTQMKKNASSVASALRLSRRTRRAKNEISEII